MAVLESDTPPLFRVIRIRTLGCHEPTMMVEAVMDVAERWAPSRVAWIAQSLRKSQGDSELGHALPCSKPAVIEHAANSRAVNTYVLSRRLSCPAPSISAS
jgi:hypothetical protein